MIKKIHAFAIWFVMLLMPCAAFADATTKILSPTGGYTRKKPFTLEVTGNTGLMKINYNGVGFLAELNGDTFQREMAAARGLNTITISETDTENPASDTITFYADVPPTALKIILSWDTDDTDLDLHVIEPDGFECYYGDPTSPTGGKLDVDVTTGYGPEIYTMAYPNAGAYKIFIYFYGGKALTEATVTTIQNEGTAKEVRKTFELMLTKPDEQVYVQQIELR